MAATGLMHATAFEGFMLYSRELKITGTLHFLYLCLNWYTAWNISMQHPCIHKHMCIYMFKE